MALDGERRKDGGRSARTIDRFTHQTPQPDTRRWWSPN